MRPHTRILYSLCDRITGEARGARKKTLGLTRRGLSTPPRKRARWGPRLCPDIKGRALDWLDAAPAGSTEPACVRGVPGASEPIAEGEGKRPVGVPVAGRRGGVVIEVELGGRDQAADETEAHAVLHPHKAIV